MLGNIKMLGNKKVEYRRHIIIDEVLSNVNYKFLVYEMNPSIQKKLFLEIMKLLYILLTFAMLKNTSYIKLYHKTLTFENFDKTYKEFLSVLDQGFYAVLRILNPNDDNHAMTIVGYVERYVEHENVIEKVIDLIVKNSWGKDERGYNIVQKNGVIENFKMAENIEIYYIEPFICRDILNILVEIIKVEQSFKGNDVTDETLFETHGKPTPEPPPEPTPEPPPEPTPEATPEPMGLFSRTLNNIRSLGRLFTRGGRRNPNKKNAKRRKTKRRKINKRKSKVVF